MTRSTHHSRHLLFAAIGLMVGTTAAAADFAPITAEEWAVESIPGDPGARSVVLSKKAKIELMDLASQQVSSILVVEVRQKLLVDPSEAEAEVVLPHSRYMRLVSLSGRTVLSGGREIPLPKDARFRRTLSERDKVYVTSIAFPGVEKGAILDYRYEMRFDSPLLLDPFYFSDTVPVRFAEVTYDIPATLKARTWSQDPFQAGIRSESLRSTRGTRLRVWAENLPAVADEPFSPPLARLATQILMIPTAYTDAYEHFPLMESWATTCRLFDDWYYKAALRKQGDAKREAKRLAASATTAREKAEAAYRFVRDEITTEDLPGIGLAKDSTVGSVLKDRKGDWAEKALLLHALLDGMGVESSLVWAGDQSLGVIDLRMPNPAWFDRLLVAVPLGGETVYLDPSVAGLPFGRLLPGLEGAPALLFDRKSPQEVVLPVAPAATNARRVKVALRLGEAGQVTGDGEAVLSGHHVWSETPDGATVETIREAWETWLTRRFSELQVEDVAATGSPDEDRVVVTWRLSQREDEALGDEARVLPQLPLGPARQPFATGAGARRNQVSFAFRDQDSMETTLEWPVGWEVEVAPTPAELVHGAGIYRAAVEIDPEARKLVYRRHFDLSLRDVTTRDVYDQVHGLFATAQKHDAEPIVLVRR